MDTKWKSDPRLKGMNPQKLELLIQFAEELNSKPKEQMMMAMMTLNQQAAAKGLSFNDAETDLIASILTENMPPEEKSRMQTLRMLAKKLAGGKK